MVQYKCTSVFSGCAGTWVMCFHIPTSSPAKGCQCILFFGHCFKRTSYTLFHVHLAAWEANKPCISNGSCGATNHRENIDPIRESTLYSPYRASQYYVSTSVTRLHKQQHETTNSIKCTLALKLHEKTVHLTKTNN